MKKIKDICILLNGYSFKSAKYSNDGHRIIRITNVQKGKIEDKNPVFYICDKKLEKYELKVNDILISLTGNVGRVGLVDDSILPSYLNQRVGCLRVVDKNVLPRYLFYILNSLKFENDCIKASNGVAQLNLSTEWIKEYEIEIPPLKEQQKFIKKMDLVNHSIDIRKKQVIECNNLVKSQFVEMFGNMKNSIYNKKILSEVTLKITDGKHGGCESDPNSGYYFIGATEVFNNKINYDNAKQITKKDFDIDYKRCDLKLDDFVIVNTGATIGKSAIVSDERCTKTLLQKSVALIRTDSSKILPIYIKYLYDNEPSLYNQGQGCARVNLLLSQIKNTSVPVPPIELQNKFAQIVEQIDKQKFEFEKSLKHLEEMKLSLMQEYFG